MFVVCLLCMQLGAAVISLKRLTMFLMLHDRSTEVRQCYRDALLMHRHKETRQGK